MIARKLLGLALLLPTLMACSNANETAETSPPGSGQEEDHGIVMLYHHVSDDTPPSTSVTRERFEQHLAYLDENGFEVWALERLLDALIAGAESVPDRVVAITFDDAYESVYTEAWPRLAQRDWPFTVFVNTDAIDAGHRPYMNWDQLRDLAEDGVAIENHSASHGHLIARGNKESQRQWRQRIRADVEKAKTRITEEIGQAPRLFAYPYGESSAALAEIVAEDHDYALVQHSGAVGPITDPVAVPRFPLATGFDSMERFAMAANARALPVAESRPIPSGDGVRGAVEALVLELREGGYRADALSCFSGGGQRLELSVSEQNPRRVNIDHHLPGSPGRNRINCTAPAADGSGHFYWYSWQWVQDRVVD